MVARELLELDRDPVEIGDCCRVEDVGKEETATPRPRQHQKMASLAELGFRPLRARDWYRPRQYESCSFGEGPLGLERWLG